MLNQEVPAADAPEVPARSRRLSPWVLAPAAGLTWWVVGFLFWLLDGLGGPGLRQLLIPLITPALGALVVGGVVGGVAAGLLTAAGPRDRRAQSVLATLGGTALALVATLVASSAALDRVPAGDFAADSRVVTGLTIVAVLATSVGWGVGVLAGVGRPGLGVALAVLSGMAPSWLSGVTLAVLPPTQTGLAVLGRVWSWVGLAVLAAALVTVGVRPAVRWAWWPLLVAVVWFSGPVLTALAYLTPMLRPGAGLPGTLPDSLAAAWQVFQAASSPLPRGGLVLWALALGGAAVVALVLDRRTTTPSTAEG